MGTETKIEWTGISWNPIRARPLKPLPGKPVQGWHCVKLSSGCKNCYSETQNFNERNYKMGTGLPYSAQSNVETYIHEPTLEKPLHWRKPRTVFVCSMTDLFGDWVRIEKIDRIFGIMAKCPQHTFQVLTKRAKRMADYLGTKKPLPNVWIGTSCEDQATADERIPYLLKCPAAVRWLSCEPLLGPIDLSEFFGYYPTHEHNQTRRRMDLRSSPSGGNGDRLQGQGVASRKAGMGPLEQSCSHEQMQASASGEETDIGLFDGKGDGRQETDERLGTSSGLASLQRTTSRGNDDQSQEREEGRQPACESGVTDEIGERKARDPRSKGGAVCESMGGEKPRGETDQSPSDGDTSEKGERGKAQGNSEGLRGGISNNFSDRHRNPASLWVICGGESGTEARECAIEWINAILHQCQGAGVPCFIKQLGANASADSHLDRVPYVHPKGGDMEEWPKHLRIRQFPKVVAP